MVVRTVRTSPVAFHRPAAVPLAPVGALLGGEASVLAVAVEAVAALALVRVALRRRAVVDRARVAAALLTDQTGARHFLLQGTLWNGE